MIAGILKETGKENRVALLPGEAAALKKLGLDLMVEQGAGERAFAPDGEYQAAGALPAKRAEILSKADLLLSINPPITDDVGLFRSGQILCSVLDPVENRERSGRGE